METDGLREELREQLRAAEKPMTLDALVEGTSAESRREAKAALLEMILGGELKTVPGFRYALRS